MGIRESLNKNPKIAAGIAVGAMLAGLGFVGWQLGASGPSAVERGGYFSDDDGKTFFVDDIDKVAPFDRGGKEAVRAYVYTCDDGATKFVGFLERYKPDAATKIRAARESGKLYELTDQLLVDGAEVKRRVDRC